MTYDLPDELTLTGEGPVRTITLNRPDQLNAVNSSMHRALGQVWSILRDDPDVRVVILTGAGRAFCAGGDLEMIKGTTGDPEARFVAVQDARRIITEMVSFPLPVIAAVNGPAVGLGCSLAVLCDIVLMNEDAYFADPHVAVGLVAADGGALVWPSMMSLLWAKEYLFTGDRIPAAKAREMGLANRVVPATDLSTPAQQLATQLAGQPRQGLRDTKRTLNLHLQRAISSVLDFALAAETESFTRPEVLERLSQLGRR